MLDITCFEALRQVAVFLREQASIRGDRLVLRHGTGRADGAHPAFCWANVALFEIFFTVFADVDKRGN